MIASAFVHLPGGITMKNKSIFSMLIFATASILGIISVYSLINSKESTAGARNTSDDMEACVFPSVKGSPKPLCLPTQENLADFDVKYYPFLKASLAGQRNEGKDGAATYLNWHRDKAIRDTGPYIQGVYYGTHPTVRIYYSPGVYQWMKNGRQGNIPDGEMIIKEMFNPPAGRYAPNQYPNGKPPNPYSKDNFSGWTIMVKNADASKDGWLWGDYNANKASKMGDSFKPPFPGPRRGFGTACLNCHTIAKDQSTFSDLVNLEGEEGTYLQFTDDRSWKEKKKPGKTPPKPSCATQKDECPLTAEEMKLSIPPETYDHVVRVAENAGGLAAHQQFVTADQCQVCHDGQNYSLLHNMVDADGISATTGTNLGQFGEWSRSMMGLAGRDPIFFAQLQSEITIHDGTTPKKGLAHLSADAIEDTCLKCHGAMGQRQFHIDLTNGAKGDTLFKMKDMMRIPGHGEKSTKEQLKNAALGRDGISCMVCHQIEPFEFKDLPDHVTGAFNVTPPVKGELTVQGPYKDVIERPMVNMLSMTPKASDFLKSAEVCASCHVIRLPVLDKNNNFEATKLAVEQSTYLEWANSDFGYGGKEQVVCQSCHMSQSYKGKKLNQFQIANIQDQTFPASGEISDLKDRTVATREDYSRHTLGSINVFALEMFNQFKGLLGISKVNVETGWDGDMQFALDNANHMAKNDTATVKVSDVSIKQGVLSAKVTVTNKTGHRFPSGVGFRRAFLEFNVKDKAGNTVWVSGATNSEGRILGKDGAVLKSEIMNSDPNAEEHYQPHFQKITSENEAQIYQELVKGVDGRFTTSFLSIADHFKDNRLLPLGWRKEGTEKFQELPEKDRQDFINATHPKGRAWKDKDFTNGKGSDEIIYEIALPSAVKSGDGLSVTASLYYQAIPPLYLDHRFLSGKGKNKNVHTDRLEYLVKNLETKGTSIANWKLGIATDMVVVK